MNVQATHGAQAASISDASWFAAAARDDAAAGPATDVRGWLRDVWALAEAIYSRPEGPPPARRLAWLCGEMRDFLEHAGGRSRLVFHGCRLAVSWVAPLAIGRLPPLRRLAVADRVRALGRLEQSPLAMPVLGVKAMLSLCWYEHPESAAEIGFDGACRGTAP